MNKFILIFVLFLAVDGLVKILFPARNYEQEKLIIESSFVPHVINMKDK